MNNDDTGFLTVPDRYMQPDGRETIDAIRDQMTDREFVQYCEGQVTRYHARAGKKGPADIDLEKRSWYAQMSRHVTNPFEHQDPRHERPGFTPYVRPGPRFAPTTVLDHGFVRLVEAWGGGDAGVPEAGIIEAARQSTQGSFRGWDRGTLEDGTKHRGDAGLLRYMHTHNHGTPFEFAGMALEVRAPIFVFRQWHRHRLFSVNEASGRYGALPALYYIPTVERVMMGAEATTNKQAAGSGGLSEAAAWRYLQNLRDKCLAFQNEYAGALQEGVPNELARLGMPVNWYSQMRVSLNLRGWLHFLALRDHSHAQWEIRQFARAVDDIVKAEFPRTWALVKGGAS